MSNEPPTLARRQLGFELRRLREAAGYSISDAAEELMVHRNTVTNIERGHTATRPHMVKGLCDFYKAPKTLMSQLTRLVVDGKKRGLWEPSQPGNLSPIRWFASAEMEYDVIESLEPEFIPGLLQIPEYIDILPRVDPEDPAVSKAGKQFRLKRYEEVFARNPLPTLRMVIGIAALLYLDEFPEVKTAQITHLRKHNKLPGVDIRVLTKLPPGPSSAFNILTPGHPAPRELAFVYIDALDGQRYVEEPEVVSRYSRAFKVIWALAIPLEEYLK